MSSTTSAIVSSTLGRPRVVLVEKLALNVVGVGRETAKILTALGVEIPKHSA